MTSTVHFFAMQEQPAPLTEARMSSREQLMLLKNDLRALQEQFEKITRPSLDDDPTPSPIEAMKMYVGSGNALKLNRYLRGQRSALSEALAKMNEGMLAFFETHARTLEVRLVMRRWVFTQGSYSPADLVPGATVTERGWLSLTTEAFHGFFSSRADVECEIALPIGARVLCGSVFENEFILRPNATLRVKQVIDVKTEVDGKKKFLIRLGLL